MLVAVHVDPTEVSQFVEVFLPDGVALLTPPVRILLALDVVHGAFVRLAQARQWDITVLDAARRAALDASPDDVDDDVPRPEVQVVGRGATAPEQPPEIRVVGGGPSNGVPPNYQQALDDLLGQVADDPARPAGLTGRFLDGAGLPVVRTEAVRPQRRPWRSGVRHAGA